jgi:hypothetical protein
MSASNQFVLGLLLLTANLSLCALFAPARAGNGAADRLVQLWKLLFLAMIEVGAWAIVLHEGGAAPNLQETFIRCAACFALAGGEGGGFVAPWGELKPFIALNGLLFIPVALIPWLAGATSSAREPDPAEELLQIPEIPPYPEHGPYRDFHGEWAGGGQSPRGSGGDVSAPVAPVYSKEAFPSEPSGSVASQNRVARSSSDQSFVKASGGGAPVAESVDQSPPLSPVSSAPPSTTSISGTVAVPPEQKPFGFRPTIPKVPSKSAYESPEAELADQMKPVGPTPPPIRFRWND